MLSKTAASLPFCIATLVMAAWSNADDFPQFRGADGTGVIRNQKIPTSWSSEKNLAWKIEVPGAGWSQPVLWGDRMFITTAVAENDLRPKGFEDGVKTPQSMGLGVFTPAPNTNIEWQLHCYNALTGESIWKKTVTTGKPQFAIHPSNTYATETPVADAQGIYAFFGATGTLAAFTHEGEPLWRQEVGAFPTSNNFGTGSSLAIYESKVIVQHLTEKSSGVMCFDAQTGNSVWKYARDKNETSWSSPIVWRNDQRTELLISGGERIESLDPLSGSKYWELTNVKAPTACSIAADSKQIYFGGSDPFSKGPLFAVKCGATGSVSPKKKNAEFDSLAWLEKQAGPGMASPVSSGSEVYVVDNNILRCYNASSGERLYQTRLPKLKMVNACPLIVDDKLLVIDESGTSALVKLGAEFEVVGGGEIKDTFWATPAVANNSIYFRGVQGIYCIRQHP